MFELIGNVIKEPFVLIGYILSLPFKLLKWIGCLLSDLLTFVKKLILAPFRLIYFLLSLPFKPFAFLFGRKKKPAMEPAYSVLEDPSMTRWINRYCDACGCVTCHKVARKYQGAVRAVISCTECKTWDEEYW